MRRLHHRVRRGGRCAACDGGTRQAAGALRTGPASGQDATSSLPASAGGAEGRQRSGDLRLPWVHALLGAIPQGSLGNAVQDAQCEPEAGDPVRLRVVSSPSTRLGQGSAHGAHEAHPGTLQLLRRERQLQKSCCWSIEQAKRSWYKWLCRRSQRKRLTWERFGICFVTSRSRDLGSRFESGVRNHEPHQRRSRMVAIS